MIVDTHCHVSDRWYEPIEVLLGQMDRVGVERAWLVQLLGEYDNGYQHACQRRHADRFDSVVGVDWTQDDAAARLADLAAQGAWGVRLRPGSRSPGEDPLAIWRAAQSLGLAVSCVGTAAQFAAPDFAAVIRACPALPIVLEHLGGIARPDVGNAAEAIVGIAALAQHPRIYLKVPGLGQLLPRVALGKPAPPSGHLADTPLPALLAAFGPDRLMWASDFPVVSTREGYGNALDWLRATLPPDTRQAILGGTALSLATQVAKTRAPDYRPQPS